MTKIRDLIEKIWWVIPLIILFFGIPLYRTFDWIAYSSLPVDSFFSCYVENIVVWAFLFLPCSAELIILLIIFLLSLRFGYRLAKKHSSLLYRITIVSVMGSIGYFVGGYVIMMIIG